MIALFTSLLGLSVAALIVYLIRRDRLHVDHGLHWIIVAIGFALLGFAPDLIDRIAVRIDIAYPPVLGLTLAIVVLVIKVLLMDIDRSHLRLKHQRLAQRVAILEGRLNRLAGADAPEADGAQATARQSNAAQVQNTRPSVTQDAGENSA